MLNLILIRMLQILRTGDGLTSGSGCTNINECQDGSHNCHPNATCSDTSSGFTCSCKSGFTGNGQNCDDVDECAGSNECSPHAECTNTVGSYSCSCNAGYSGNHKSIFFVLNNLLTKSSLTFVLYDEFKHL